MEKEVSLDERARKHDLISARQASRAQVEDGAFTVESRRMSDFLSIEHCPWIQCLAANKKGPCPLPGLQQACPGLWSVVEALQALRYGRSMQNLTTTTAER